jgi:hypothetical protein
MCLQSAIAVHGNALQRFQGDDLWPEYGDWGVDGERRDHIRVGSAGVGNEADGDKYQSQYSGYQCTCA